MKKITIVVFAWLIIGIFVGGLGVLFTSIIPFFGLGLILGTVGAITHSILILFDVDLSFWQGGFIVAFISSAISIIAGTMGGDNFNLWFILSFLSYYSAFGIMLYFVIEKYIINFFTQ